MPLQGTISVIKWIQHYKPKLCVISKLIDRMNFNLASRNKFAYGIDKKNQNSLFLKLKWSIETIYGRKSGYESEKF